MQFYLNGYQPGDPAILTASPGAEKRSSGLPETVDVLIVGSGPAGMVLAAQLSTFPGISTRLVERRSGPLQVAQADGAACPTVDDAFGLSAKLVRESYWVIDTGFWRPSPEDGSKIVRIGRIQDTDGGLQSGPWGRDHNRPEVAGQRPRPAAVPMPRNAGRCLMAGLLAAFVARARKGRIELAADQFFDELPRAFAHHAFDRIETSKSWGVVSPSHCQECVFVILLIMAWSPIRRSNAG